MLNIEELEKEKMEKVKELASTNMKISEAKNLLFKLQEDETAYLVEREKKALNKIDEVLKDSQKILKETHSNYAEVHEFCQTIVSFVDFLHSAQDTFKEMLTEFRERDDEWQKEFNVQQEKSIEIKKILGIERINIEKEKKWIENERKKLSDERSRISSQQHQIKVALELLKRKQ